MSDLPDKEQQRRLHQRLIEDDPTVAADIADALIAAVEKHLKINFSQVDEATIWDAATQAFMNYFKHPQSFDPAKSSLLNYLKMSAVGDLKNARKKEHRRTFKIVPLDNVAFLDLAGNSSLEEQFIVRQEASDKIIQLFQQRANDMDSITFDETERKVLALMDAGERRTVVYAKILGITHLPKAEQAQQVKNYKDKLNRRRERSHKRADSAGKKNER